jgi:hypothetical protein
MPVEAPAMWTVEFVAMIFFSLYGSNVLIDCDAAIQKISINTRSSANRAF